MKYNVVKRKIKKLYNKEKNTIITKHNGIYKIGNIYEIFRINDKWKVIKYNKSINIFNSAATAISWCLANLVSNFKIANRLKHADSKLQTIKNEILVRKLFLHRYDLDKDVRSMQLMRLTDELYICKELEAQIKKYISQIKINKQKGFIKLWN